MGRPNHRNYRPYVSYLSYSESSSIITTTTTISPYDLDYFVIPQPYTECPDKDQDTLNLRPQNLPNTFVKVSTINLLSAGCEPFSVNLSGVDKDFFAISDNDLYFNYLNAIDKNYTVNVVANDLTGKLLDTVTFTLNVDVLPCTTTTTLGPTITTTIGPEIPSSAALWLRFQGNFNDSSSNNFPINNINNNTITVSNPSVTGSSAYFNGSSCLYLINAPFQFNASNWKIDFWIYPTQLNVIQALFFQPSSIYIYLGNDNKLYVNNTSGTEFGFGSFASNQWYRIVIIKSNNVIQVSINDIIETVNMIFNPNTSGTAFIGSLTAPPNPTSPFTGYMDDFIIY